MLTKIQESIISSLSVQPTSYIVTEKPVRPGQELKTLHREFPNLDAIVRGKKVLDFGCGRGHQALALVERHGCRVTGLDTNTETLKKARKIVGDQVELASTITDAMAGAFDVVISQNAMEHFDDPVTVLQTMKRLAKPDGHILITFGPPWLAPFGHHMHFFCKVPWLNLLFSERAVMRVRSRYIKDGATRYHEVTSGLNKMTIRRFERLVAGCGLEVEYRRYTGIKGVQAATKIPVIRELFINHATVKLKR